MSASLETIDRATLKRRLDEQDPDNEDRSQGFALVNVLDPESFAKEHLPGSINIQKGQEDEFERRFERDKEIIVYCASPACDASESVAEELVKRGFTHVVDYAGGTSEWKAANLVFASNRT